MHDTRHIQFPVRDAEHVTSGYFRYISVVCNVDSTSRERQALAQTKAVMRCSVTSDRMTNASTLLVHPKDSVLAVHGTPTMSYNVQSYSLRHALNFSGLHICHLHAADFRSRFKTIKANFIETRSDLKRA